MKKFAVWMMLVGAFVLALPATAQTGPLLTATTVAFAPAVIQADPGEDITFKSLDPTIEHAFTLQNINVSICGSGEVPIPCYVRLSPLTTAFISIHREAAPGTYVFECAFHRWMVGRLTVGEPPVTP